MSMQSDGRGGDIGLMDSAVGSSREGEVKSLAGVRMQGGMGPLGLFAVFSNIFLEGLMEDVPASFPRLDDLHATTSYTSYHSFCQFIRRRFQ